MANWTTGRRVTYLARWFAVDVDDEADAASGLLKLGVK